MKIIAYNIEFAKTTTPQDVALHLKPEMPDVICFSEVPNEDWTALAGAQLAMDYCYVGKVASANHEEDYPDKTGDYNDLVDSEPMQRLYDKGFNNAWQAVDYDLHGQKTCDAKSEKSFGVIDHLLYRGTLKAVDAKIIKADNPQSDHYAISTSFLMAREMI